MSVVWQKGVNKIAQKVEEAVETVIEAKDSNDDLFLNESADLFFHVLILLRAKGFSLDDVVQVLQNRNDRQLYWDDLYFRTMLSKDIYLF